jgi:hypothetical protein
MSGIVSRRRTGTDNPAITAIHQRMENCGYSSTSILPRAVSAHVSMINKFSFVIAIGLAAAGCSPTSDDAPTPVEQNRLPIGGDVPTSTETPRKAQPAEVPHSETRPHITNNEPPPRVSSSESPVPPASGPATPDIRETDSQVFPQEDTQTGSPSGTPSPSPAPPAEELPEPPESPGFTGSWYPHN